MIEIIGMRSFLEYLNVLIIPARDSVVIDIQIVADRFTLKDEGYQ